MIQKEATMGSKHKHQMQAPSQNVPAARPAPIQQGIPTPGGTVKLPPPSETLTLIQEIERIRESRVITFFAYPDVIVRGDIPLQLYAQLRRIGRVPKIDLFIHSTGGESEVPWRIITLIRNFCKEFRVLIPFMAYSAATHIAMGADEIVMGDMSELGPVDPARAHPLLPKENDQPLLISVQDLRHCIEFLKREGGEYTPESLATIYSALFDKVHPLALGAIEQSYALARLISEKALGTHMNPETEKEKIARIVNAFSDGFFSHNYRIGWKEAKDLGLPITYTNDNLWEAMWKLYEHYAAFGGIARQLGENSAHVARPIVWIDSSLQRQVLEEIYISVQEKGQPLIQKRQTIGAQWLSTPWKRGDDSSTTVPESAEHS